MSAPRRARASLIAIACLGALAARAEGDKPVEVELPSIEAKIYDVNWRDGGAGEETAGRWDDGDATTERRLDLTPGEVTRDLYADDPATRVDAKPLSSPMLRLRF